MSQSLVTDLAALADPPRRLEGARALAAKLDADDLLFFVRDVETATFLPAVGFPKTLPEGRTWRAFITEAHARGSEQLGPGTTREMVCPFTKQTKRAFAVCAEDARTVAVLLGGAAEHADLRELISAMPMLGALFRAERALAAGAGHAEVARRSVQRAEALAASLASSQAELHRVLRELHQSREWLSTTLRSIGDAVITTDVRGRVTFMNRVAEALTGWTRARPPASRSRSSGSSTKRHALRRREPSDAVLREGMIVGLANHTILIARDGSEVPIDDSAAPIRDEQRHADRRRAHLQRHHGAAHHRAHARHARRGAATHRARQRALRRRPGP